MATCMEAIEVDVPVRTAYNQWTQFEEFPEFMEGVQDVRQVDATHLHWTARVAGDTKEWTAEITEQIPDERVAWRSESGAENAGVVTFHKIADGRCRVTVQIDAEPGGVVERAGDALGLLDRRVRGDLERFKAFIEGRARNRGLARRGPAGPDDLRARPMACTEA